ncbi:hypothetical protein [Streptomyces hyaluromycini]|uniref:hypothetical protein n=1 Tax=Streptomyces hyaluromycini TaxID=1377993 RepID=UPI001FE85B7C|nr:hypothetical protein [Streptomyces hyaluromycini]
MTDPGLTPPAERPDPPSTHRAPPSYSAPGLIPPGGPARTWGLVVIATPLLLALILTLIGSLAGGSGSSGSSGEFGASGSGSGLYGSGTSGSDGGGTGGQPTYADPTTASAWPYGDTSTPTDAYGTPDATTTTTDGFGYPSETAAGTPGASPSGGPGGVVTAYFAALDARDYQTAWALGGKNLDSSYDSFVSGYSTTEQDTIAIVSVTGTKVRLTIEALQTDGTTHSYDATYTVQDGVITSGTATQTG